MNDHNLDDLIIDNIEPKNSKTKSFLTIIALLIVVLIVAIILTKIILKDPNAEKLAFEENNTELISPELTLQSATEHETVKEEERLSTIIESKLEAPAPLEEITKKPVAIKKEVMATQNQTEEEKVQKEKEYNEIRKARLAQEKAERAEAEAEKIAQAKQEKAKKVIAKKEVKKTVPKKVKVRPTKKPVNVPKPKPIATQTYYIQVGSFSKTPSTQFLSIIKNSGFNHKITSANSSGTKKLLIGPYKNRKSVDTALIRVRDRINKSAFVVKK